MKRLLMSLGAAVLGLTLVTVAQAKGPGGPGHSGGSSSGNNKNSGYSPSGSWDKSYKMSSGDHNTWHNNPSRDYKDYHLTHGKQFSQGFSYPGKEHYHWKSCYFDKRYGCYLYYDPFCSCHYYYCVPDSCYYPITYCPYRCYGWGAPAYFPMQQPAEGYAAPPPPVPGSITATSSVEVNR